MSKTRSGPEDGVLYREDPRYPEGSDRFSGAETVSDLRVAIRAICKALGLLEEFLSTDALALLERQFRTAARVARENIDTAIRMTVGRFEKNSHLMEQLLTV